MDWEQYQKRYSTLGYDEKIKLRKEYNLIPKIPKPTVGGNTIQRLKEIAKRNKCSLDKVSNYMGYKVIGNKSSKIDPGGVCENAFTLIKCLEFCKD